MLRRMNLIARVFTDSKTHRRSNACLAASARTCVSSSQKQLLAAAVLTTSSRPHFLTAMAFQRSRRVPRGRLACTVGAHGRRWRAGEALRPLVTALFAAVERHALLKDRHAGDHIPQPLTPFLPPG